MTKKEHTEKLKGAVRENLFPIMDQLGFDASRKKSTNETKGAIRGFVFFRQREGFEDKVEFYWDKWGAPLFMIQFITTQKERMKTPGMPMPDHIIWGRFGPGHRAIWQRYLGIIGDGWYGRFGSIENTIETAKDRLVDLDAYLKTGSCWQYVWAG